MIDYMPPMPGVPIPKRDLWVFIAFMFFVSTIGFAIGWFVAKFIW